MRVIFSDAALQNLEDLRRYLEDRDPGAATSYGERFEKAFAVLEDFPKIGRPGDVRGTREYAAVHPYIIIYQIDVEDADASAGGQLTVLNIWRGERDRTGRS